MLERVVEQLRRDPLPTLIRRDHEADNRAGRRVRGPGHAPKLVLGRRVAPANNAAQPVRDHAVGLRGADELTPECAVLFLGPTVVVVHQSLAAVASRPVRVVRVRDQIEVVHDGVVLIGTDGPDRDVAHRPSLPH